MGVQNPDSGCHGADVDGWHRFKPGLQRWRARRAAAAVPTPAVKTPAPTEKQQEGEHASASDSQR
ncbi:hypothetical protein B0D71_26530 [Pseudomonas laurylsulfativorans]|uniref:Uncharacterized protein n=1 Tax=Pseudomonas laurylsulfativorans TaxID=1943631 RepID=A0A2S3VH66_9PSED|nr:hypothetical protein B0D71_26530 [Pseudomonas laurylsulfativorans]